MSTPTLYFAHFWGIVQTTAGGREAEWRVESNVVHASIDPASAVARKAGEVQQLARPPVHQAPDLRQSFANALCKDLGSLE